MDHITLYWNNKGQNEYKLTNGQIVDDMKSEGRKKEELNKLL